MYIIYTYGYIWLHTYSIYRVTNLIISGPLFYDDDGVARLAEKGDDGLMKAVDMNSTKRNYAGGNWVIPAEIPEVFLQVFRFVFRV